jgi:hypothetical protein
VLNYGFASFVEHVAGTFDEKHSEDKFFELAGIHFAAQDVGGFEEVPLELGEGESGHNKRLYQRVRPQSGDSRV